MSNQTKPTIVTTGKVRLSYVHLFTPHASQQGQEPKYSVTILLPKSDIATKQRIDAAINAAIQEGIASKWNGVRPPQVKNPIWDGDGVRQNGEPFGLECKGHWVITASSKQPQAIVDLSLNPIINQSEIYSGMYARVNINFFPYFNSGNKGIGCGLGPVQKVADGEPLGGQMTAESAFGDSSGYAPPIGYNPQPQQPQYNPGYRPQPPSYVQPPQQPYQVNPGYGQPNNYQPQQPQQVNQGYGQNYSQQSQQQYDPITGAPMGVMGLDDSVPF